LSQSDSLRLEISQLETELEVLEAQKQQINATLSQGVADFPKLYQQLLRITSEFTAAWEDAQATAKKMQCYADVISEVRRYNAAMGSVSGSLASSGPSLVGNSLEGDSDLRLQSAVPKLRSGPSPLDILDPVASANILSLASEESLKTRRGNLHRAMETTKKDLADESAKQTALEAAVISLLGFQRAYCVVDVSEREQGVEYDIDTVYLPSEGSQAVPSFSPLSAASISSLTSEGRGRSGKTEYKFTEVIQDGDIVRRLRPLFSCLRSGGKGSSSGASSLAKATAKAQSIYGKDLHIAVREELPPQHMDSLATTTFSVSRISLRHQLFGESSSVLQHVLSILDAEHAFYQVSLLDTRADGVVDLLGSSPSQADIVNVADLMSLPSSTAQDGGSVRPWPTIFVACQKLTRPSLSDLIELLAEERYQSCTDLLLVLHIFRPTHLQTFSLRCTRGIAEGVSVYTPDVTIETLSSLLARSVGRSRGAPPASLV